MDTIWLIAILVAVVTILVIIGWTFKSKRDRKKGKEFEKYQFTPYEFTQIVTSQKGQPFAIVKEDESPKILDDNSPLESDKSVMNIQNWEEKEQILKTVFLNEVHYLPSIDEQRSYAKSLTSAVPPPAIFPVTNSLPNIEKNSLFPLSEEKSSHETGYSNEFNDEEKLKKLENNSMTMNSKKEDDEEFQLSETESEISMITLRSLHCASPAPTSGFPLNRPLNTSNSTLTTSTDIPSCPISPSSDSSAHSPIPKRMSPILSTDAKYNMNESPWVLSSNDHEGPFVTLYPRSTDLSVASDLTFRPSTSQSSSTSSVLLKNKRAVVTV